MGFRDFSPGKQIKTGLALVLAGGAGVILNIAAFNKSVKELEKIPPQEVTERQRQEAGQFLFYGAASGGFYLVGLAHTGIGFWRRERFYWQGIDRRGQTSTR